ncbi:MAG: polysaccharide biosynthesis C-terminal domain-containing protein [Bacteroidales bacterium]|jgi:O-antigen/teichoic acid export membrane protein|nr:polysaccharide biosynthesis C-terminal domain-containing protein [Bacteroidales bacterium]
MKRLFLTNLAFLLLLNVLIKAFWILGIDRGVQNAVASEDYGLYFALLNFTYIFNVFLDLGLTNWNNRQIAQHSQLLPKYFARLIPMKIVMSLAFTVIIFTVAIIAGKTSHKEMLLLFWLCVSQILVSLILYLRSNVSGLLMFKTDSVLSVLDRFLMVVICGVLLWTSVLQGKAFRIEYFVYSQVVSYAVTALIAAAICLYKTGFIKLRWNYVFMLKVLKDCYPYALLTLLMSCYNKIDSVMLLNMLKTGDVASAIYAAGFRLVDSANMIAYLFSIILLPLFANMIKSKISVQEVVKVAFHILITISVAFATLSQFYTTEIINLMYNKHITESMEVFRVLSFCFIPISMTYIFGTLLTANGSLRKLNIVAFCGMISNIGFDLLLIPHYEALGAAYSSLITQSFTALLQVIIALKIFNIKLNFTYIIKIFVFILSLVASTFLIRQIAFSWLWLIVLTALSYVLLALVFRIFSLRGVLSLVKSVKSC